MNLLLKREQTDGGMGRVKFKLWAKAELDEDEAQIVKRYRFDEAKLIDIFQPGLLRNAITLGLGAAVLAFVLLLSVNFQFAMVVGALAGAVVGYFYYDHTRESVWVRDLIHGRHFACDSVVDLARKEAWLALVVSFLRQVMVSAKHWDGTETVPIAALSQQEAKYIAVKGI